MSITRTSIIAIARTWIGTPYHHQASLKGTGADCIGLVRGIWRELFGEEPERLPAYSGDWAEATGRETMLQAASRHLVPIEPQIVREGDVIVFRLRAEAVAKHVGVVSDLGRMIHAQEGAPVAEVNIGPWWRRRIAGAFSFPNVID
ncbi:MAG: NlpC/P60 family protein [Hyphomicrobiaceae bacterium]